jgi:hypothetical protein
MEKIRILCLLALMAIVPVAAELKILHPKELKEKIGNNGEIRASLGNFGSVHYGTSIVKHYLYTNFE